MIGLLLLALVGCGPRHPPPWLTSVRITGPDPGRGVAGLTADPDLPPLGPHLSDAFAGRRTEWQAREVLVHPWSRWWQFIPFVHLLTGTRHQTIDPLQLDADARRLEGFFAERGWRDAAVRVELREPTLWIARLFRNDARHRTFEAHYTVVPGVRQRIGAVQLQGDPVALDLGRRRYRHLEPGEPWGTRAEAELRRALEDAAQADGHGAATVEIRETTDADGVATVVAHVERGEPTTFGTLSFEGNTHLTEASLRRAAGRTVAEGTAWNPSGVHRLERRLGWMPGVAHADVQRAPTEHGETPLVVTLQEAKRSWSLPANELFGRPGTRTFIFGRTFFRRHVLTPHTLARVKVAAGFQFLKRRTFDGDSGPVVQLGAGLDLALEPTGALFLHASLDGDMDQWQGYHYVRGDAELGPRWQRGPMSAWVGGRVTSFTAYSLRPQRAVFERFFESGEDGNAPLERDYRAYQTVVHVGIDTVADPIDPRRGGRFSLDVVPYGRVEGATLQRFTTDLDTYWPLNPLLTLRLRAGGGLLDVRGSDVGLLLGHRLYGGGARIVRGWPERGIRAPGTSWNPGEPRIGGNVEAHATFEPRLHIHPHATFTPFVDVASVWEEPDDASFDTLRWSTGAGLRFPLVIGEGHLILAWVVGDPQQTLEPGRFRFHLTLEPYRRD